MSDITDFLNNTIYPLLFERIDAAFQGMNFRRTSKGWESPFKLNGERAKDGRKDKSVITTRRPQRVLENGCGSLTLIDFYGMKNGIDTNSSDGFIEALDSLCGICGVELPQMKGADSYKAQKEKQEALEKVADKMKKSLLSDDPKAKATLSYLTDGRKYDREFIEFAEFGFVDGSSLEELSSLFSYKDRDGRDIGLPKGVGSTHSLAIPYRTGGRIKGFVFRTINQECKPKYKDAFISASASKKYNLFGLTGLRLTGNGGKDRDITIVEGEIDCLRASFAGLKNVVAASGGNVYKEALQEAKLRGVRRVTLLFDTEASEDSQKANYERVKRAITTIQEEGLIPLVCYLESPDNSKMDVDSYLQTHTGEELASIVEKAVSATEFLYGQLLQDAIERQGGEGELTTYKNLDEFKRQVIELANNKYTLPIDRSLLFNWFRESTGNQITDADIQQEADLAKEIQDKALQSQGAVALTAEAYRLAKDGRTEEALYLLQEKTEELKRISDETKFKDLLKVSTRAERIARFKDKPVALETSYQFTEGGEFSLPLTIPSGALTIVAAPTSHGKSTFLRNLTLDIARKCEKDKSILYFTFEECEEDIIAQLTNTYIGKRLHAISNTHPQVETLTDYFRTGDASFIGGRNSEITREDFIRKELEFSDNYLDTGRIRVFNKDYDLESLIEALEYAIRHIPTKAIFIDYIQILRSKKFAKLIRTEQLKEVCISLKDFSVKHKVPVILAAQLNREAKTPLRMDNIQMAESSDIEKAANTIICIWNSQFKPTAYGERGLSKDEKEEIETLSQKGFELGKGGKVFIKLTKKRGSRGVGMYSIMEYQGYSGKIVENYNPSIAKEEPQQNDLPFSMPFANGF